MPVITDKELIQYQEGLKQVERLTESNQIQKVESERNLNEVANKLKKSKKIAIVLGVLALIGIGSSAYYASIDKKDMISLNEHNKTIETLQSKTNELESLNGNGDLPNNTFDNQEIYAVQVGAFEEKDLSLYSESFVNFKEIRDEKYNKYALGNFESLNEAKQFRKELVSLGLTDAFIGVYLDGERIRIEKVF